MSLYKCTGTQTVRTAQTVWRRLHSCLESGDCERNEHHSLRVKLGKREQTNTIFTYKRPGFSTVDDVFFLRHFSINCSESLVMDGIRFSMCFYLKNFRGLLAVECKFWKPRTAPSTEQLHVIHDHDHCVVLHYPTSTPPHAASLALRAASLPTCAVSVPPPRAMWTPPAPVMGLPPHPASTP